MLSSFQGGRKEKPLAVRKEAHFNKALLCLEKGKQDEKSSPHYTVVLTWASCLESKILAKTTQKKKKLKLL